MAVGGDVLVALVCCGGELVVVCIVGVLGVPARGVECGGFGLSTVMLAGACVSDTAKV